MVKRIGILKEFLLFLRETRAWWMAPIVVVLLVLAWLVSFGGGGLVALLYTVF